MLDPGEPDHRSLEGAWNYDVQRLVEELRTRRGAGADDAALFEPLRDGAQLVADCDILAYFLALSINDVILGRVAGGVSHLLVAGGRRALRSLTRARAFYDAISRRDISTWCR